MGRFSIQRSNWENDKKVTGQFASDLQFDLLYPPSIRRLAEKHWSPLSIARKAAHFLSAEPHVKILDIGSGVGKFCLAAALVKPEAFYYGIEQRRSLIYYADRSKELLG